MVRRPFARFDASAGAMHSRPTTHANAAGRENDRCIHLQVFIAVLHVAFPRAAGRYAPGPHEVYLNPRVDLMLLPCKRTKPARRTVTAAGMSGRNRALRGGGGAQAAGPARTAGVLAGLDAVCGA